MRPEVQKIDPRGRLDVLVYRILDRLAQWHCPAEWPVIEPAAWELCSRLAPRRPRRRRKARRRR